jgi:eukaryotic translation initiation factor 2C
MVTNLEKMMVERLTLYRTRNENKLPGRVLVYRDGVSEVGLICFCSSEYILMLCFALQGQFLTVVGEELPAMKAAFRKFNTAKAPYNPKLTIVICVSFLDARS